MRKFSTADEAAFRILDLTIATIVLIVTTPLLLVIVAISYLVDGAPVMFRQSRVGTNGEVFDILKLRTMVTDSDASAIDKELSRDDLALARARFRTASEGDSRVTVFGKALRATHLDELPQLVNVILGDLSLVGVRPDTPVQEVDYPAEYWRIRHVFRPGITGPGQLYGSATVEERMENEMQWLHDRSLRRYLKYLLMTVGKVLKGNSF